MRCHTLTIGAGPAGIAAAIQLVRAGLKVIILEKAKVGGLIRNANLVENYPGLPEGTSGQRLAKLLSEHLARVGIEPLGAEAHKVTRTEAGFLTDTTNGDEIASDYVILATGTLPKPAGLPGEEALVGQRLFYEIADLPDSSAEEFIIIGGGDVAFDYALRLSERARAVWLVTRSEPRCLPLLLARARQRANLNLVSGFTPLALEREGPRVRLLGNKQSKDSHLTGDMVLVAVGRRPNRALLAQGLDPAAGTNAPEGLFLVGDVRRDRLGQVGMAVGEGLWAATEIINRSTGQP